MAQFSLDAAKENARFLVKLFYNEQWIMYNV